MATAYPDAATTLSPLPHTVQAAALGGAAARGGDAAPSPLTGCPHFSQNRDPARHSAPQLSQNFPELVMESSRGRRLASCVR